MSAPLAFVVWLGWIGIPHLLVLFLGHDQRVPICCALCACADVGGWFGGKLFGRYLPMKPYLIRDVSPNKTVVGYGVGCTLAIAFGYVVALPMPPVLVTGAVFGDLLASFFKRRFGVGKGNKDFGWMVGSHGGILDRLDHIIVCGLYSVMVFGGVAI